MNILQAISRLLIKKEKIKQNSEATEGKTNMKPQIPFIHYQPKQGRSIPTDQHVQIQR